LRAATRSTRRAANLNDGTNRSPFLS